jgi:hypothetical protein
METKTKEEPTVVEISDVLAKKLVRYGLEY